MKLFLVLATALGVGVIGCSAETLDAGSTIAPISTKQKPTTRATLDSMIDAFTMDATSLYFTCEDGFVYRLEKSGSSAPVRIAPAGAPGSLYTEGIAVDDANVYWTALGDGLRGGVVYRASKSGGPAVPLAQAQDRPWGIALDDSYVYWADQGAATPPSDTTGGGGIGKGSIQRLAKSNGSPEVMAAGLNAPDFIALDESGGVVWHDGLAIRYVAKEGLSPTTLLTRPVAFRTTDLLLVSGRVVWADDPSDEASVWSASLSGDVEALAANVDPPASLASFGSSVFWNVATGSKVGAIFGAAADGKGAAMIAPPDAYGDTQAERALFLLADDQAFYSVEFWATTHLTVAIRVLAK